MSDFGIAFARPAFVSVDFVFDDAMTAFHRQRDSLAVHKSFLSVEVYICDRGRD